MNKDVKRMHFAKLVDGKCIEFRPEVKCSDDGLVVTYTYKSLEDLKNEGFKELVIKPTAAQTRIQNLRSNMKRPRLKYLENSYG